MQILELVNFLEKWAPASLQENYDNSGLIVGDAKVEISNVLVSLDCTEEVIEEAITRNCNVVVAHHPIIFKGLKSITGKNYIERTILKAIKNDIAIFAFHTNLDNIYSGVNQKIAQKIGLINTQILCPKEQMIEKLTVFVPLANTGKLLDSLYAAGAGEIGNYANCSFRSEGMGTFKANEKATPTIGSRGIYEEVAEHRIEVIYPFYKRADILKAMRAGHVYEEISYFIEKLENAHQEIGSGMVGELETPMLTMDFLKHMKEAMDAEVVKYTNPHKETIKRVALCGGSGSFLLSNAIRAGADIFITADFKYHEFFDANGKIIIADIGHYESEQFTKDLIRDEISKKFTTFATYLSAVVSNPVNYLK